MTGITLVTRLSGRGENSFSTIKVIMQFLFGELLHDRVRGRNLVFLDRGYLEEKLVSYFIKCGLTVLGTHKRVKSFPFTFGEDRTSVQRRGRRFIAEEGAKSVYWAERKSCDGQGHIRALAYRMGNGRVATLITTSRTIDMGAFVYIPKWSSGGVDVRNLIISEHLHQYVEEMTSGQGGLDWHYQRAAQGAITSTLLATFLRVCQSDIPPDDREELLTVLGIESVMNILSV